MLEILFEVLSKLDKNSCFNGKNTGEEVPRRSASKKAAILRGPGPIWIAIQNGEE